MNETMQAELDCETSSSYKITASTLCRSLPARLLSGPTRIILEICVMLDVVRFRTHRCPSCLSGLRYVW